MQCNTFRYLLKPDKTRLARFKSGCHLHVGASCISLAPTFFKSQSALIPLLLLSDRDSLRWIRGRFLTGGETKLSRMKPPDTSEQSRFAPTFFYSCGTKTSSARSLAPPFQPQFAAEPLAALPPYGCGVPLAGAALDSRLGLETPAL